MITGLRFPFAAFVGYEKLKKAYLANIINPKIGGLLVSGPKGTGKSTIVHSVVAILPDYLAVDGCIFECDPDDPGHFCAFCRERAERKPIRRRMSIVTLPLSCTEDRLIGSIDIEHLLKTGEKKVIPGILGTAHRNILYVDEVNLLPDHLVDDILDAAALHWNSIEREGISISHPAEFVLVGTMNPEEGDLRPQILDRFPLCSKLTSVTDPAERMEIVKRNLQFEQDARALIEQFDSAQHAIADMIVSSRSRLPQVTIDESRIAVIARSCADLKVDGQRPDIVITKTAMTLAAMDRRNAVEYEDIVLAAELALVHRTRDGGLLEPPGVDEIGKVFKDNTGDVSAARKLAGSAVAGPTGKGSAGAGLPSKKKKK